MSKLSAIIAGVAVLPVLAFTSPASAVQNYGSIGGGNIVTSKNVTKNGVFTDVTSATCGETVKVRIYIHNPGPNALENVKVKAELPTGKAKSFSAKMTASASNANPASESDTTTINSDKDATLNYVTGSAEYFNASGGRIGSLNDSIVTTGADLPGGVEVSTLNARYAQIQAKLNCDTPKDECKPGIPMGDKRCETVTVTSTSTPTTLVKTGAGDVAAIFAAAAAFGVAAYSWMVRRQKNA